MWDERYAQADHAHGTQPNDFRVERVADLTQGAACGRPNARGWDPLCAEAIVREITEGKYHRGQGAVVRFFANEALRTNEE